MAVLLDSGFLLASLNSSEAEHQATITVLESIREPFVLPVPGNHPTRTAEESQNRKPDPD
jgi:predicted nucleic acid-binding protein